jgi:hypothetical protein
MATASRQVTTASVQIGRKYRVERTFYSGTKVIHEGIVMKNEDEYLIFEGGYLADVHPSVAMPQAYIYEVD